MPTVLVINFKKLTLYNCEKLKYLGMNKKTEMGYM